MNNELIVRIVQLQLHRESKTPNFIQSRIFENPTVIRSNFAQFAPNNVLKGINFGYFLGFSINYRIKSRSNAEKYPIMIRILSNQVIGYFLERDWVFGRSIFTERIFFGVFGSLCLKLCILAALFLCTPDVMFSSLIQASGTVFYKMGNRHTL